VTTAQRALAAVLKETANAVRGLVQEEDGLLLVAGNHPCPVLVNSALRTGPWMQRKFLIVLMPSSERSAAAGRHGSAMMRTLTRLAKMRPG
jgi:hypothetical protein